MRGGVIVLSITESAHKILQCAIKNESSDGEKLYVRLTMGIGWGGPQLRVALEERPLTNDQVFNFDEVSVLIHERDLVYFNQSKLDYTKDVFGIGKFNLLKV